MGLVNENIEDGTCIEITADYNSESDDNSVT